MMFETIKTITTAFSLWFLASCIILSASLTPAVLFINEVIQ